VLAAVKDQLPKAAPTRAHLELFLLTIITVHMMQQHSVLEPKLPLDIISLVSSWHVLIESRGAERVDFWPRLKMMSLIARAWLHPCRDVLFEHFHLGTPRESKRKEHLQVSRFVFLLLHPKIAQHVKFAHIWNDRLPSAAAAEVIAGMPTAFPNLNRFQIESMRYKQPLQFMTLIPEMLRQLSRLEFLDLVCMRNVLDPSKLCLKDLRLKHIQMMAPAQKLLPLMQAAVASLEQAAQPVRSGTFLATIFTDLGQIERMHHTLSAIKTWTRLKIMYQGAVLTTLSATSECAHVSPLQTSDTVERPGFIPRQAPPSFVPKHPCVGEAKYCVATPQPARADTLARAVPVEHQDRV
jgi:hypothetical protein